MGLQGAPHNNSHLFNHCINEFNLQILESRDGNANIKSFVDRDAPDEEKNIYKSQLEFQSITAEYVGKYYCVFNNSIKDESENFDDEVEKYKASSIYIFVDGKRFEASVN